MSILRRIAGRIPSVISFAVVAFLCNPAQSADMKVAQTQAVLVSAMKDGAAYLLALARSSLLVAREPSIDPFTTSAVPSAVFGSVALPFSNLPAASRWRHVNAALGEASGARCQGDESCLERGRRLERAVDAARNAAFVEKLRTVNSAVNAIIGYASDRDVYDRMDYWATPAEALRAGRGDCEDYAILKMAALKAAGVPARSMSLVVLRDRKRDLFHAVLAVTTDQGHFILDNAHDVVLPDSMISRYQPLFSMSQDRSWVHGVRRTGGEVASRVTSFRAVMPGEGPEVIGDFAVGPFPADLSR